jgi:hypothetical protein
MLGRQENNDIASKAMRSDPLVKSAHQLQALKTLPSRPNSLPDCTL